MALLDARKKLVEIGHVAELGHDLPIVTNVVAVVGIERVEVWAQPDDVDAELLRESMPKAKRQLSIRPKSLTL